jgi:hypothetical protein
MASRGRTSVASVGGAVGASACYHRARWHDWAGAQRLNRIAAAPRAPTNVDDPAPPPRSPPDAAEHKRRKDSQAKFTPEQREAAIAEFKRTYVGLPGCDRRWEAWKRDFYETGRGPWLGREDLG